MQKTLKKLFERAPFFRMVFGSITLLDKLLKCNTLNIPVSCRAQLLKLFWLKKNKRRKGRYFFLNFLYFLSSFEKKMQNLFFAV